MRKPLNLAYCRRQAAGANCSAVLAESSDLEPEALQHAHTRQERVCQGPWQSTRQRNSGPLRFSNKILIAISTYPVNLPWDVSTPRWDGIPNMLYALCILLYAGINRGHVL